MEAAPAGGALAQDRRPAQHPRARLLGDRRRGVVGHRAEQGAGVRRRASTTAPRARLTSDERNDLFGTLGTNVATLHRALLFEGLLPMLLRIVERDGFWVEGIWIVRAAGPLKHRGVLGMASMGD